MNFTHNELKYSIDPNLLKILKNIDHATNSDYFLIGATARDFTFHNIFGLELSARATEDCDIAVCVESWEDYKIIRKILIDNHGFCEHLDQSQRLISESDIPIDLIPFGKISVNNSIQWPDSENVMSVDCYQTAHENSNKIIFDDFNLNLVSIEMFVSLKLVAWDSRKVDKDLNDIVYVIENYSNLPFIIEQITTLGIADRFDDINKMAAAALALNIRESLDADSFQTINKIFEDGMNPQNRMPLIRRMQKSLPPYTFPNTKAFLEIFYSEFNSNK